MGSVEEQRSDTSSVGEAWDHSSHEEFYGYYANESLSSDTLDRFRRQRDLILSLPALKHRDRALDIADIGCGAGTLAMIWAESGHQVVGLDINAPLIELARKRVAEAGFKAEFFVGSATDTRWPDGAVDVCFAPELLEHVADWKGCLDEFTRILRPGGVLFVSTTNVLCPIQREFNLPLYSWYPGRVKRHYERLASSVRPELANYATYPAVNWFTYYSLRSALARRGFETFFDRFDLASLRRNGLAKDALLRLLRHSAPLRFLAHAATEGTTILAVKGEPRS